MRPEQEAAVRRLCESGELSRDEYAALLDAMRDRVRTVAAGEDLSREGERPTCVRIILSGWTCRYKMLADGRRQIVSLMIPGDLCDYNLSLLLEMDHSVGAITTTSFAELPQQVLDRLAASHPRMERAFWRNTLACAAIGREWVLNIGQRVAYERLAHLLCEILVRMQAVGLADGNSCMFPLTQSDLADATGLSVVHVNRTLQELRSAGLISLSGRTLTVPNLPRLEEAALFSRNYLALKLTQTIGSAA